MVRTSSLSTMAPISFEEKFLSFSVKTGGRAGKDSLESWTSSVTSQMIMSMLVTEGGGCQWWWLMHLWGTHGGVQKAT